MGVVVECYTLAHRRGTCGCAEAARKANADPGLDAALLDMAHARERKEAVEKLAADKVLVDELIATAMDLGALKAPDGILRLTDRLTELRAELLARLT